MHCALIVLLVIPAFAQHEKTVESKISHVTVFLTRAQVTREAKARIQEGTTNLVIKGLTAQLDPNSIQVSAKGSVVLLGISHQQNYLNEFATSTRIRTLNDSLHEIQNGILFETTQKNILDKEENMLLSNQKIGGSNQNLPVNELKNMADFFRTRLSEISLARLRHEERIKKLNEALLKVQQQVRVETESGSKNTSEIVVNLSAKSAADVELDVKYVVANAGWVPLYDLRGTNTRAPLSLLYKANVFQSTGENWKNVRLKLSTANPTLGGVKPDLHPWHLDFYQREYYQKYKRAEAARDRSQAPSALSEIVVAQQESETTADFVNVIQTSLNTEFDIALPYSINSAGKASTVDIARHDLKANYRYAATPKLDPDAFLLAGATGWSDFNLLPGEANVFFEGTFVGKTFIDPQSIKDTLFVSLGRDKRIVIKRQQVKDFKSQVVIGLNQRESHGFEIEVRNNQSEAITITLEDQIPVSNNSLIEVSLLKSDGAKFSSGNGKLEWEITLKPNETRKFVYQFEVKFPKDKSIAGLN